MKRVLGYLLCIVFLSACLPSSLPATPTSTHLIQTNTATSLPVINTATATTQLTSTPTNIPSPTPTPAPAFQLQPITLENAGQLENITASGYGDFLNIQLSPDKKNIVIGTRHGVQLIDPQDYKLVMFLPMQENANDVYFIEDGSKLVAGNISNTYSADRYPRRMIYIWDYPSGTLQDKITFQCPIAREYKSACFFYPAPDFSYAYFTPGHLEYKEWRFSFLKPFDSGNTIRLDRTGELLEELAEPVFSIAFSPDGTRSLRTSKSGLVLVEEASSTTLQQIQLAGVTYAQFLDNETLMSTRQNILELWKIGEKIPYATIATQDVDTDDVIVVGGKLIIHSDNIVYIVDFNTGDQIQALSGGRAYYRQESQELYIDTRNGLINQYTYMPENNRFVLKKSFQGQFLHSPQKSIVMSDDGSKFMANGFGSKYNGGYITSDKVIAYDPISGNRLFSRSLTMPREEGGGYIGEIFDGIWNPAKETFLFLHGSYRKEDDLSLFEHTETEFKRIDLVPTDQYTGGRFDGAAFSPDSRYFAFVMQSNLFVWDLQLDKLVLVDQNIGEKNQYSAFRSRPVVFSLDGKIIGVRDKIGEEYYYKVPFFTKTHTNLEFPPNYDGEQTERFFNPDPASYHFEIRETDVGYILQFDMINNETGQRHPVECGYSCMTLFNPENTLMAIGKRTGWGGQFELIDPETNSSLFWSGWNFSSGFIKIFLSPDSRYLIVQPLGGFPQLWGVPEQ